MRKKPPKSKLRATVVLMRRRLAVDERGATAIEYALVASGIGVAIAATVVEPRFGHPRPLRQRRGAVLNALGRFSGPPSRRPKFR